MASSVFVRKYVFAAALRALIRSAISPRSHLALGHVPARRPECCEAAVGSVGPSAEGSQACGGAVGERVGGPGGHRRDSEHRRPGTDLLGQRVRAAERGDVHTKKQAHDAGSRRAQPRASTDASGGGKDHAAEFTAAGVAGDSKTADEAGGDERRSGERGHGLHGTRRASPPHASGFVGPLSSCPQRAISYGMPRWCRCTFFTLSYAAEFVLKEEGLDYRGAADVALTADQFEAVRDER